MYKPTIFISYSHKDKDWKDQFLSQLGVFVKQDLLNVWEDRRIGAGEDWYEKIQESMKSATVAVLLISQHFLTSDFILREEVTSLLRRRDEKGLVIFPVLIRACNWQVVDWLSRMQVRPTDARPVASYKGNQRDEVLAEIALEVYHKFKEIGGADEGRKNSEPSRAGLSEIEPYPFRPLTVGYVSRQRFNADEKLLEFLKEKLSPSSGVKFMILRGKSGMGKTASAQEAVKALQPVYRNRVVWVAAHGEGAITFSEVVDSIIRRLRPGTAPAPDPENRKHQARLLLRGGPTLIAIDDFAIMAEEDQESCINWLSGEPDSTVLLISWRAPIPQIDEQINVLEKIDEMTIEEAKEFWVRLINRGAINEHVLNQRTPDEVVEKYSRNPFILYRGVLMYVQVYGWAPPEKMLLDKEITQHVFLRYFELGVIGEEGREILLALSLFTPWASPEALATVAGITDSRRFNESLEGLVRTEFIFLSSDGGHYELDKTYLKYAREYMKEHPLAEGLRERFVKFYVHFVESHAAPTEYDALEAEKENIFEGLRLARAGKDLPSLLRMLAVLGKPNDGFFEYRGYWDIGLTYGGYALEAARERGYDDGERLALLTCFVAGLLHKRGQFDAAWELLLPLAARGGSISREAYVTALHLMGMIAFSTHEYDEAEKFFLQELSLSEGEGGAGVDLWGVATATQELGRVARVRGRFPEARKFFERSLEVREILDGADGDAPKGASRKSALHDLGLTAHQQGEWEEFHGNPVEARELYKKADDFYGRALKLKRDFGNLNSAAHTLTEMGELERLKAAHEGTPQAKAARYEEAERLLKESLKIKEGQLDELHMAYTNYILGRVALDKGDVEEAQRRCDLSRDASQRYSDRGGINGCRYLQGLIEERKGDKAEAARLFRQALGEWQDMGLIAAEYAQAALVRVGETSS
jgi:tetratricopeptide (TPR) repeat protein